MHSDNSQQRQHPWWMGIHSMILMCNGNDETMWDLCERMCRLGINISGVTHNHECDMYKNRCTPSSEDRAAGKKGGKKGEKESTKGEKKRKKRVKDSERVPSREMWGTELRIGKNQTVK